MQIILATNNPSKAEQIRGIFRDSPFEILSLAEAGITGEAVEDAEILEQNSLKKARFAWERLTEKTWTMADDTGIFIRALGGAPGARAARWAGEHASTDDITRYTLARLEGQTDRTAVFRTVVTVVAPNGAYRFFDGTVHGSILEAPRVRPQPKMPYSPIFVPEGSECTWAEMTLEEENRISHRGKAFRQALAFFEEIARAVGQERRS